MELIEILYLRKISNKARSFSNKSGSDFASQIISSMYARVQDQTMRRMLSISRWTYATELM